MGFWDFLEPSAAAKKAIATQPVTSFVSPAITGSVGAVWNGLSTTGKVLVGAGIGGAAVGTYDWIFGKKAAPISQNPNLDQKQSQPVIVQPVVVQPNNPVNNQYDYSTNNNWISNSPNSSIDSKKSMPLNAPFTPSQYVPFYVSPTQSASAKQETSASQGTDWATLAAIAGVALVAYGYTSRKGK